MKKKHRIAFDSSGRLYDDSGNYTDWWDEKTIQAFEERAQCFVDQYEEFTVPGPDPDSEPLHVNGRLTLGENIADAGGLSAAYHAWKKREDTKSDPQLPGLDGFSKEQLFFISYASFWCGKTTKEAAISSIYNNPHPPNPARIMVRSLLFFFFSPFNSLRRLLALVVPLLPSLRLVPSACLSQHMLI
jgi:endothelin-converting enzyme